jgi:hypothetical protein
MPLQDYANMALFADQTNIEQLTSLNHTTNSGQQRVDLLNVGLGGFSPGSGDVSISVGFSVPVGGQEYPWQAKCAAGDLVTLQIVEGAFQYSGTGKLMDVDVSQSVNGAIEGTANWVGELKPFE